MSLISPLSSDISTLFLFSDSTISDSGSYLSVIKSENVITYQKVKVRLTLAPSSGNVIGYIGGISDGVEVTKGYVLGGYDGSDSLKDTDEYNPDTWTSKTDMPSPERFYVSNNSILNKLYSYFGETNTPAEIKDCDEYNPDTWTSKTDGPSPCRRNPAGVSI